MEIVHDTYLSSIFFPPSLSSPFFVTNSLTMLRWRGRFTRTPKQNLTDQSWLWVSPFVDITYSLTMSIPITLTAISDVAFEKSSLSLTYMLPHAIDSRGCLSTALRSSLFYGTPFIEWLQKLQ